MTDIASALAGESDDFTSRIERKFGAAPPAARLFAQTLFGDRSDITENHFKPPELAALRQIAEKTLAKGQNSFGYGDYGEKDPWNAGVIGGLTDPAQSLAFTLGMANVERAPDGSVIIKDRYHWAASPEKVDQYRSPLGVAEMLVRGAKEDGLLGVGHVIGNFIAPQGQGRNVRIRLPGEQQ